MEKRMNFYLLKIQQNKKIKISKKIFKFRKCLVV